MSLPQIGALVNRDPSTVGYWVQKHGLVANGRDRYAPKGGIAKEDLEPWLESGATLSAIARQLDVSMATVRYWIDAYGLLNPRDVRRASIEAGKRAGRRHVVRHCRRHGRTEFAIVNGDSPRCKRCRAEAVARRRRKVKQILVEENGGKCGLCGYDRNVAALQFHHLDPTQKSFGLAQRGMTRAIEEVRREARKCALLCANCHAEVEAGVASLDAKPKDEEAISDAAC